MVILGLVRPGVEDRADGGFLGSNVVGRRWMSVVLTAGYLGARRLTEYRRFAEGISDRVLTQQLRELEEHGLIERTRRPHGPGARPGSGLVRRHGR